MRNLKNNQAKLLCIGCTLMLSLICTVPVLSDVTGGAVQTQAELKVKAEAEAEKSKAAERVKELIHCLVEKLSEKDSQVSGEYLFEVLGEHLKIDATQIADTCKTDRTNHYAADDFASYAMGVSLQKKLLQQYEALNWIDFINGLLRADSSTVRVQDSRITRAVEETLLGDAEASQQYLDQVADSSGVKEVQGVFIKTLSDTGKSIFESSEYQPCNDVVLTRKGQKLIKFYQVKPIDEEIADNGIDSSKIRCIVYEPDNVIRGWRLVINELNSDEKIHDVLIPSELAYGATGVPGMVEADENLRFLMQVIEKKQSDTDSNPGQ